MRKSPAGVHESPQPVAGVIVVRVKGKSVLDPAVALTETLEVDLTVADNADDGEGLGRTSQSRETSESRE